MTYRMTDKELEAFLGFLQNRDIYLSTHDQLELCWQAALEWERGKECERAKAVTNQELDRASEQAYWSFRNLKNAYLLRNVGQQTERDVFKAECHKLIAKYMGAIPEGWQLASNDGLMAFLKSFGFEFRYDKFVDGSGYGLLSKPYKLDDFRVMLAAAPQPVIRNSRNTEGDNHE